MTIHPIQIGRLAPLAALALGLSALAAPAHAMTPFGATAGVSTASVDLSDGGDGSFSASKTYTSSSGANGLTEYGAASLADGKLHASSLATHEACNRDNCYPLGGVAYAAMWDTVYFHSKDGGPLESISLIPLFLDIDGQLEGQSATAKFRTYYGSDASYNVDSLEWQELSTGTMETLDSLIVPLTDAPIYVYFELWTQASANGSGPLGAFSNADFGNTMSFNWVLPDDVVAESASGVFLSGGAAAVPEPATWTMMILGFGLVGMAVRRRPNTLCV
jgi:hypothetical protein